MSKKLLLLLTAALLSLASTAYAQEPVISFTAASYSFPEQGPNVTAYATMIRTGDLNATVSYNVRVTNSLTGQSYTESRLFAKPYQTQNVYVTEGGVNDKIYNPGRKYVVEFLSATGASIGTPSSAEVNIIDDEQQPQLAIYDVFSDEGNIGLNQVILTVRLTTALATGITIPFTLHSDYAKDGVDYFPPFSHSVHFNAGATTADIVFSIRADRDPEGDETVDVVLGAPPSNSGIIVANGTGTLTIRDDDGAVTPLSQRVAKGVKVTILIRLTDPALTTEHVILQSSAPFLVFPSSVQIPAGASSADIEVGATAADSGTILVTLPSSRGGRIYTCQLSAFDPIVFSIDPLALSLSLGGTANVILKIDPPPDSPITLPLTQTVPAVAEIPPSVVVDQKGTATVPVRGVAVGSTSVSIALPETLGDTGGTGTRFSVTVNAPTGLTISNLSQKTGRASGGETVKVFGYNFDGRCIVTFGGIPSPTNELPANGAVTATTPPHDAGAVDVGIRCGNTTFVSPNAFTYTAAPLTISQLSPASGGARGGTIVVVRGVNLRNGLCTARFGGVAARAIAWIGTTSMTVVSPPHVAGTLPLTLQCGSDTATFAGGFNYVDADDTPPAISTTSVARAAPGDRVTILGSRFRLDDVISFDTAVAPDEVTPTGGAHVVVVPELAPGTVTLSLRDVAGRITAGPKIEITAPAAVTISQLDARLTAGAEFAITGTGFRRALTFALGLAIVQPVSITPTRVLFRVPPGLAAGPASFTISDHGTPLLSRPVDVTSSGLAVTAISPPCSAREGGLAVTISGSGFENGAMVRFGTTYSADVAFQNAFTLTAKVPPAFGGADPAITVTNPDGTAATLTNLFVYKGAAEGGCTPRRQAVRH